MFYDKLMRGFFMDADGGASGAGEPTQEQGGQELQKEPAQGGDEPAKRERTYTEAEAQAMIDGALSRKLKGMPSKEEVAEFKKWKESQQTEAERIAALQREAEEAKTEAEKLQQEAAAKIAAATAGISAEYMGDALALAMIRISDEVSIDEAMKQVAEKNPSWTGAKLNVPGTGANPAKDAKDSFEERYAEARKAGDTLEAIKIKREAAEAGTFLT